MYASIHALVSSFFMAELAELFVGNFSQWLTDGKRGVIFINRRNKFVTIHKKNDKTFIHMLICVGLDRRLSCREKM